MKRLTRRRFERLKKPFEIDDIVFLPAPTVRRDSIERIVEHHLRTGELERVIPPDVWERVQTHHPRLFLINLGVVCSDVWRWPHEGIEPKWIDDLPAPLPGYMRRESAIHRYEALAICVRVPNTGIAYIVKEDGLCGDIMRVTPLWRLNRIKQFGFLTTPTIKDRGVQIIPRRFSHTRYQHSLDVMAIATLEGWNLGLRGRELNKLRIAALVHDLATPAGGDTTKMIDERHVFDEDINLRGLLEKCDWTSIEERYGITREDVLAIIEGTNQFLCHALDIADKAAYIAHDVAQYIRGNPSEFPHRLTEKAMEVITLSPYSCTLWENVHRHGDDIVFLDSEQLAAFLTLRVLMFRCLYYNPDARFLEFVMAKVILQHLYDNGTVTKERLLTMTDDELDDIIANFAGVSWTNTHITSFGTPRCEGFGDLESALARESELIEETPFTVVEQFGHIIKPSTHWKVRYGSRFLPIEDAYPELIAEALALSHIPENYILFWLENPEIKPEILECLDAHRKRELAKHQDKN